jgi:hypothetical protein
MSQYDFSTIDADTKSGAALAADLNAWRDALHQMHSGGTAPSYAVKGTVWLDDSASPWVIKFYDGVTWITVFQIDEVANQVVASWIKPDGTEAMTGDLTLANSTPTAALHAASKGYVDAEVAAIVIADDAVEVAYDNATSGLTATDVQAALDEIDGAAITQAAADTRYLNEASNLSDLPSAATARTNLGLGAAALLGEAGLTLQTIYADSTATASITTVMPHDNTIPQKTEGNEVVTAAITPKRATSNVIVDFVFNGSLSNNGTFLTCALFLDSEAGARSAAAVEVDSSVAEQIVTGSFRMALGNTSAHTFKLRAGPSAGTLYQNQGPGGANRFGAVGPRATLKVTEVAT